MIRLEDRPEYRIKLYEQGLNSKEIDDRLSVISNQATNDIFNLLESIKKLGVWKIADLKMITNCIHLKYKYPNGKFGVIDDFLARTIGQPTQISPLDYQIQLCPAVHYKEIELLAGYYNQQFCANKVKQFGTDYNKEPMSLLLRINRIWKLYEKHNLWQFSVGETSFFSNEIYELIHNRFIYMKDQRDQLYQKAILEKKATPKWSSETKAFTIVHCYYHDAIFQYKPKWLGLQSLDIYIPSRKVAIEYQGIQHYYPVPYFGGEASFEALIERDRIKAKQCTNHGILLLEWRYDYPLTEEWFKKEMLPKIEERRES